METITTKRSKADVRSVNTRQVSLSTLIGAAKMPPKRICWHTDVDTSALLTQMLTDVLAATAPGKTLKWLPQYDEVADWLKDNKGLGLLLYGTCGQGKTLLARYVLPALVEALHHKIVHTVDATALTDNLSEYKSYTLISIDDLGTEVISQFKTLAFGELIDLAEKRGGMVILTTNLNGDQLRERYGDRIFDRILGLTKRVAFTGKSLRG